MRSVNTVSRTRINGMIDFTSGWLVANVGHDRPEIMRAVQEAAGWAVIDGYRNKYREAAEKQILSALPGYLDRIALYNSGSEAIESAVRLAGWAVLTHERSYHGSTIFASDLKRIPHWDRLDEPDVATVLIETFLGPWCEWHPPEFVAKVRERQRAGTARVIFDEMQAGVGRTGRWWGFEHYDIEPDFVVGGKAVAGGFPLAFVAGRHEFMDGQNTHESTFSGNALSCAAAARTIQLIRDEYLIENVVKHEHIIRAAFPQAQGKGFAYAFPHADAEAIVTRAAASGLLLLNTRRQTVKICPPLCMDRWELEEGLDILKKLVR